MKTDDTLRAPATSTYTPGHTTAKRLMIAGGVLMLAFGLSQLWHPLRLMLLGARTRAEVVRVVKEKTGLPPLVLTDGPQLQAQLEPRDRSYIFWNEFRFHTADGTPVEVRANVGSQLKPLYSLTDTDGLPPGTLVCYDPAAPQDAVFPLIASTWLAPAVLVLAGAGMATIGGVLLYWANKPIELPQFAPANEPAPIR